MSIYDTGTRRAKGDSGETQSCTVPCLASRVFPDQITATMSSGLCQFQCVPSSYIWLESLLGRACGFGSGNLTPENGPQSGTMAQPRVWIRRSILQQFERIGALFSFNGAP
jgi:hypothetical protein